MLRRHLSPTDRGMKINSMWTRRRQQRQQRRQQRHQHRRRQQRRLRCY